MTNRIDVKFEALRGAGCKAFVAFITAGDPDLRTTEELVLAFEDSGVDIVELGVPFSDPLADGPTIQAASYRALKNGTTLEKILKTVARIRKRTALPLALMTYYNPVFHFGEEAFVAACEEAGVDGVIIPDLPPEEAGTLISSARHL
ncbi:MAG TPA: tryptophan synthase subunit alpha, partial [Candidatus Omnitrophota bacterium]|nr:tryptophan synthase subunit alpha [Candidatus Omnitrophota bacterium]